MLRTITAGASKKTARNFGKAAVFGVGLAAPAIGGAVLAPTAGAAELPAPIQGVANAVENAADQAGIPLPELPSLPSPVVPSGDVLPTNLLRRDDNATDGAQSVATQDAPVAGPGPDAITPGKVVASQLLSGNSDNLIGELVGVANIPNQGDVSTITDKVNDVVNNITSGQAMTDLQNTYDNFFQSDSYRAWADNTDNAFSPRNTADYASPVDRAADGIQAYIDSFSRRPAETLIQTIGEAGGPIRLLTDPVGAVTDVLTKVAGPEFVADIFDFVNNDLIPDTRDSLREALPALLLPLLTGGLGAALGALGGTLASLPLMAGLPLLGSSAGSAIALAILATVTYGTWIASIIPVAGVGLLAGVVLGLIAGVALAALAGFNPIMIPAAIGGGLLVAAFVFTMIVGGYVALTFLIPTIAFLLLSPLFLGAGAGLGALAGLGIGTLLAALIIPASTIGMGALGALAGIPTAIGLFLVILLTRFSDRAGDWVNGPLGRIMDALNKGWERSSLRHIFDDTRDYWNGTDTGSSINDLLNAIGSLFSEAHWLDGKALRDLLVTGAALGGLAGVLASILAGATTGTLTGALMYIPNLILVGGPWLAIAGLSLLTALVSAIIPPIAIAAAAWIIGSLLISSPLWVPLTILATLATLVAFIGANPLVVGATGGAAGAVAVVAGTISTVLAIIDVIVIVGALAIGLVLIGLPVFLLALPLFTFGALASQIPTLLSLPFPFIVAAGMSVLEGTAVGLATTGITMPFLATAGAVTGAIIALLSALRINVGVQDGAVVGHASLVNNKLPGVEAIRDRVGVAKTGNANYGTGIQNTSDRSLVDITRLVAA